MRQHPPPPFPLLSCAPSSALCTSFPLLLLASSLSLSLFLDRFPALDRAYRRTLKEKNKERLCVLIGSEWKGSMFEIITLTKSRIRRRGNLKGAERAKGDDVMRAV